MTNKELFQQAKELDKSRICLSMVMDYLDTINYAFTNGDKFSVMYFFADHRMDNVGENLQQIIENMLQISNAICPDEFDSSEAE
ncbi:hypothetical protein AAC591_08800 [Lactiplantibacillus plantarum]|uniref:hypothetical protein n=1 Tax=Lactiplantibacillus plantarum TaxID=1590 RepID=UPI00311CB797